MADDRITIFFEPKGHKELINAMNALARSQKRLTGTTKQNSRSMVRNSRNVKKARKEFNLLGGTLSVVRSKLLVWAFAMQLVNKTVGATIRLAMKQEDAEKKLSVQLGYTSQALQNYASDLQKVTQFGDEEILSVMGQISAFTKNEEEIKKLTQATLDLSEGMGMNLNEAGMLIGKTFGSTTNSLSRYGISVKGASSSTKRLESLTDNVQLKYGDLSKNIDTTSKAVKQMKNALGDAGEEIGEAFLPMTKRISIEMTNFTQNSLIPFIDTVKSIDFAQTSTNIMNNGQAVVDFMIRAFAILPKALTIVAKMMWRALVDNYVIPVFNFFKSMSTEFADLVFDNMKLLGLEMARGLMEGFNTIVSLAPKLFEFLGIEQFDEGLKNIESKIAQTQVAVSNNRLFKLFKDQFEQDIETMDDVMLAFAQAYKDTIGKLVTFTDENTPDDGQGGKEGKKGFFAKLFGMTDEQKEKFLSDYKEMQQAIMGVAKAYETMTLQNINNAKREELERANSIRSERRRQKEVDRINEEYDKKTKKAKEDMKEIKVAEAISNTALGITKAYSEGKWFMATLVAIQGALQIATIKGQKYEYGGMVGGNRHSQGGTMIEAERGEYVVSRRGVDAIGLQALNRINSGQVGGASIVINNPILSKDVVEDELIPQIKNAIRKGYGF